MTSGLTSIIIIAKACNASQHLAEGEVSISSRAGGGGGGGGRAASSTNHPRASPASYWSPGPWHKTHFILPIIGSI
jgi:hypothetical protein